MTTLEIVLLFLLSPQSPFGTREFVATPLGDKVQIEFPHHGVTLLMDKQLHYVIIKGEVSECQPEEQGEQDEV